VRVIGLTGGIASGKSTVAGMFRDLGVPIVDADLLARQVVEPGTPAMAEIARAFGPEVIGPDGQLDRKRLGERIFTDPAARAVLNAITHPRIAAASAAALGELAGRGQPVALYEAALLVENRIHERLGGLIVVSVPLEVQIARLRERDHLDEEGARSRISAQLPLAEKVAVADWVVDNGGSVEHTRVQVEQIWRKIQEKA
jgi:dephospho-CoA kinase